MGEMQNIATRLGLVAVALNSSDREAARLIADIANELNAAPSPATPEAEGERRVALDVPIGECLWLLEQTSNQDGVCRFWNGRLFCVSALNAARFPDKGAAEDVAWRLNGRDGQELGEPHGKVRVCDHMFQCGPFPASPPAARELNLKWGRHDARGEWHIEWHAPCGCAYHPDPKPHIHPCIKHAEIDQCAE